MRRGGLIEAMSVLLSPSLNPSNKKSIRRLNPNDSRNGS